MNWVFNANEVTENVNSYAEHFPGHDVVDILATDVYRGGFAQADYQQLLALAGEKPIALGEVGRVPSPEILANQPRWTWFMTWADLLGPPQGFKPTFDSDQALTLEELPWVKLGNPKIHYPVLK